VRIAPLINPAIRTDMSIVKRRDRPVTAAMRSMINYIKHELGELSASGELPGDYFQATSEVEIAPKGRLQVRLIIDAGNGIVTMPR
jgi:hypothetical protein